MMSGKSATSPVLYMIVFHVKEVLDQDLAELKPAQYRTHSCIGKARVLFFFSFFPPISGGQRYSHATTHAS